MGTMDSDTISQEFTVIGDFITYYKWLFDVSVTELFLILRKKFRLFKALIKWHASHPIISSCTSETWERTIWQWNWESLTRRFHVRTCKYILFICDMYVQYVCNIYLIRLFSQFMYFKIQIRLFHVWEVETWGSLHHLRLVLSGLKGDNLVTCHWYRLFLCGHTVFNLIG